MLLAGPPTPDSLTAESVLRQQEAAAPAAPTAPSAVPAGWRYWRSVARLGIQVADALHYAHQQGTLHRDIKPANLLMDNRGTVWIADFGLAKLGDLDDLTHSGDMVGTLRYMAPEQFEGKADARSDVYSLGLTLYELLTLRPAFDQQDRRRLIRQMTQEEPPRPRKLNPAIPLRPGDDRRQGDGRAIRPIATRRPGNWPPTSAVSSKTGRFVPAASPRWDGCGAGAAATGRWRPWPARPWPCCWPWPWWPRSAILSPIGP